MAKLMAICSLNIFSGYTNQLNEKHAESEDKQDQDQEENKSPVAGCCYSFSLGIHNTTSQLLFSAVSHNRQSLKDCLASIN